MRAVSKQSARSASRRANKRTLARVVTRDAAVPDR